MTRTQVYRKWAAMKQRCLNKNASKYRLYGGRGIGICARWMGFEAFFADMGHPPTRKHELDRIDNNGDYTPENCRWATRSQQVRNTRVTKLSEALAAELRAYVAAGGRVTDWAKERGVNRQTAYNVTKPSGGAWA